MRSLRIAALAIIFSLVGTSAHSNTPPLPGFNADGSVNTNLPTPIAPPAGFVPPPGYVPPLPSQFNSDGALAFTPNGTPLAGFNADGSANTNLPAPIRPPGFVPPPLFPPGTVPPPGYVPPLASQFNSEGALAFRPDGTPLAGFNADGSTNTNLPAPIAPPGFLAPLPPPLFNPDGTAFKVGSKLIKLVSSSCQPQQI